MKDSTKCKEWERRRRDKLNDAFNSLEELLPFYDPAKSMTKIDILKKSTQFIKEIRLTNSRLLVEKCQPQETSKAVQQLQDEVNKLILRVKQLTQLLKQANITIPIGPSIKLLGRKRIKWSAKLVNQEVENDIPSEDLKDKKTVSKNAKTKSSSRPKKTIKDSKQTDVAKNDLKTIGKNDKRSSDASPEKTSNDVEESEVSTVPPSELQNNPHSDIETSACSSQTTKENPSPSKISSESVTGKEIEKELKEVNDVKLANKTKASSTGINASSASVGTSPVGDSLKPQQVKNSQLKEVVSTPTSSITITLPSTLTPVNFSRQITIPNLTLQPLRTTFILTTPITCSLPQSTLIQHPLLSHLNNNVNNNNPTTVNSSNILPKFIIPSGNTQKIPIRCIRKPSPRKIYKPRGISKKKIEAKAKLLAEKGTQAQPTVVEEIVTLEDKENKETNNVEELRSPSPELVDISKEDENEDEVLPSETEQASKSVTASDAIVLVNETTNQINSSQKSDEIIDTSTSTTNITSSAESKDEMEPILPEVVKENNVTSNTTIENIPESESQNQASESIPELLKASDNLSEESEEENTISEEIRSSGNLTVAEKECGTDNNPTLSNLNKQTETEACSKDADDSSNKILPEQEHNATESNVADDKQELVVCTTQSPSPVTYSLSTSTSYVQTSQVVSKNISVATVQNTENCMSDLNASASSLREEIEKIASPVVNNVEQNHSCPSAGAEEDGSMNSDDKISECIARSIGLIDDHPACSDLMELSTDWSVVGNSHSSTKSPISPTQMFLSMFPLLPRDSLIGESLFSQSHKLLPAGLLASSNSRSSFFIDSMLPEEQTLTVSTASSHNNSNNATNATLETLTTLSGAETARFSWTLPSVQASGSSLSHKTNKNAGHHEHKRGHGQLDFSEDAVSSPNILTPLRPPKYARVGELFTTYNPSNVDKRPAVTFSTTSETMFPQTLPNGNNDVCSHIEQNHLAGKNLPDAELCSQPRPVTFCSSQNPKSLPTETSKKTRQSSPRSGTKASTKPVKHSISSMQTPTNVSTAFSQHISESLVTANPSDITTNVVVASQHKQKGRPSSKIHVPPVSVPTHTLQPNSSQTEFSTCSLRSKCTVAQSFTYLDNSHKQPQPTSFSTTTRNITPFKINSFTSDSEGRSQGNVEKTIVQQSNFSPSGVSSDLTEVQSHSGEIKRSRSSYSSHTQSFTPGALFQPTPNVSSAAAPGNMITSETSNPSTLSTSTKPKSTGHLNKSVHDRTISNVKSSANVVTNHTPQNHPIQHSYPTHPHQSPHKHNYTQPTLVQGPEILQTQGSKSSYENTNQSKIQHSFPTSSTLSPKSSNQFNLTDNFPRTSTTYYPIRNNYSDTLSPFNFPTTEHQPFDAMSKPPHNNSVLPKPLYGSSNVSTNKSTENTHFPFYISDSSVQKTSETFSFPSGMVPISQQTTLVPPPNIPLNTQSLNNNDPRSRVPCPQNQQPNFSFQPQSISNKNTNSSNNNVSLLYDNDTHLPASITSSRHSNSCNNNMKGVQQTLSSPKDSIPLKPNKNNYYDHQNSLSINTPLLQYPLMQQVQHDNSRLPSAVPQCPTTNIAPINSNRYVPIGTSDMNNVNNTTFQHHRHLHTTVNWMTDQPSPQPLIPTSTIPVYHNPSTSKATTSSGKKSNRSSNNNNTHNLFSVSTLVGTNTGVPNSNYCAEALIRKNHSNWNEFPVISSSSVPHNDGNNSINCSSQISNSNSYTNVPSNNHQEHHHRNHPINQQYSATQQFNCFENTSSITANPNSYIQPQCINRPTSFSSLSTPQPYHQQLFQNMDHHPYQCHSSSNTSVTNFNLSTIFPEINDKRLSNSTNTNSAYNNSTTSANNLNNNNSVNSIVTHNRNSNSTSQQQQPHHNNSNNNQNQHGHQPW